MTTLHTILHFTWCLPQTLLGLILRGCGHGKISRTTDPAILIWVDWLNKSCFSLGRYIFYPNWLWYDYDNTWVHELGHSRQSLLLGWLYIPVIAIPSVCWFYLHKWFKLKCSYYWFYTEKWANRLAGINLE